MGLPQYTGPFQVGAIDLEIPVRNPQSFGSEFVSNEEINKPKSKRKSKVAEMTHLKAKEAAHLRHHKGDKDTEMDEAKHSKEEYQAAGQASSSSSSSTDVDKDWNPLTGGSKTTTLHLSTVLFTIFYPSDVDIKTEKYADGVPYSKVSWMGRPKRKALAGFLQYMGSYGTFAYAASPAVLSLLTAKIPAIAGARLADPNSDKARASPSVHDDPIETGNFGGEPAKFPLIIFSHGLAGSRLSYSQFCGELASHGVIVAAMEHRDGSGISSLVRVPQMNSPSNGTKPGSQDGGAVGGTGPGVGKMNVPYFPFKKIGQRSFAEDPSEKESGLRQSQMAMREAEIMECLHIMQEIDNGKGEEIANSSTRGLTSKLGEHIPKGKKKQERSIQESQRLKQWKGKVDVEYPCLAGHSFGACTVIEMQRKKKKGSLDERVEDEKEKPPFPFSILLDPWVEPIQWRDEGQDTDPRPMIAPAFAINSESFTIWKDHFQKLKRIMHDSRDAVEGRHGWLFTLCGCQHLDFSDFPFLLPHIFRSTVGPKQTISVFCRATYAQMGLMRQRKRNDDTLPGVKTKEGKVVDQGGDSKEDGRVTGLEDQGKEECVRGQFGGGEDDVGQTAVEKEPKDDINLKDDPQWKEAQVKEEHSAMKKRRQEIMRERKSKGLVAVFAKRSASGKVETLKDGNGEEFIDFSIMAKDVAADEDADKVHQGLEDICRRLEYKKPKIHSLMAMMLRLSGLHPGLANPGQVLIHQY